MMSKGTPARRYTVTTAPAYLSPDALAGVNRHTLVGHFARKGEALAAAQDAIGAFRVCVARVMRERWETGIDYLTGKEWAGWMDEAHVKDVTRTLKAEERETEAEKQGRAA